MSKTDKTRPMWVKVRDKSSYLMENHDHTDGVCNLPERPAPGNYIDYTWSLHFQSGDCGWVTTPEFWSGPDARCPCYMCSKFAYEADPNKKRRRDDKRYCRDGWRDEY